MIWVYFGWEIGRNPVFGPTFMAAGAAVFLAMEGTRVGKDAAAGYLLPVAWLGRHSYELYLFHIVVLAGMRNVYAKGVLHPFPKLLWFAVFLSLSTALAWVISRYYAEPWNRKIRGLRSQPAAAGT